MSLWYYLSSIFVSAQPWCYIYIMWILMLHLYRVNLDVAFVSYESWCYICISSTQSCISDIIQCHFCVYQFRLSFYLSYVLFFVVSFSVSFSVYFSVMRKLQLCCISVSVSLMSQFCCCLVIILTLSFASSEQEKLDAIYWASS